MSAPIYVYATIADIDAIGLLAKAFASVSDADKNAALATESARVAAYGRSQWQLPLVAVDAMVVGWVVDLACYRLMGHRGYNPSGGQDVNIRLRYEDTIGELKLFALGKITPGVTDSASGSSAGVTAAVGPAVYTTPLRGYSNNGSAAGPFVDGVIEET